MGNLWKSYSNAYSGINRNIWLLALVMLINRSGTMVLAYMTLYIRSLGYSIEQAGMVVASFGIGSVLGGFLGGKLSDKYGFYNVQFLALFTGGLMFLFVGTVHSYNHIIVATFFLAVLNESVRPANSSAIAYYSTPANRTKSFSLVRLAINLGWGIGSALGGFLASFNYSLLFKVDGFTNISAAIMLLVLLPRNKSQMPEETLSAQPSKYASPWKDGVFMKFIFFTVIFAICFFQLFSTLPLYLKEGLHLDEYHIGIIMSGNGILIALIEMYLVSKLEGRVRYTVLMALGALLMGVGFLSLNMNFIPGFILGVFAMLIITISEMICLPFMNSYYLARTTLQNRGNYAGINTMAWSIAQVIASGGGTYLADHIGFNMLWIIIFVLSSLAAAGYFFLQKRPVRKY